jgi:hypothetical protein
MLWFWRLFAGLSARRPGFEPMSVHVRFVVNHVALGWYFYEYLRFPPSMTLNQFSVLILIHVLLLPD